MEAAQKEASNNALTLRPVHAANDADILELYEMLAERTPDQAISHRVMPSFPDHISFVQNGPYLAWYLIVEGPAVLGNIYITHAREVGIHIKSECRKRGYGTEALRQLRERHPGRLLANINPKNARSIAFFTQHGGTPLQLTLELP